MRSTLFLAFLLLFYIAAVNCGPLPSNEADELVQDGGSGALKVAEEHGNNGVKLLRPGYVELVISGDSLVVGVDVDSCKGKVLFCYAAKPDEMSSAAQLCSEWPDFCGFQLIGTNDGITLTIQKNYPRKDLKECSNNIKMQYYGEAQYCKTKFNTLLKDQSCGAAISQDGRIGIHVSDVQCEVFIRNAKIYAPPTTTPVPSTAPPSIATTIIKHEKADEASIWPWIVLGVGIALILIGILIGIFLCWFNDWCMFKKKTADTSPLPHPVESIVSTTVEAKADEKIEKEYEKIKAQHPELKQVISKKSKKALPAPPPPSAEPPKKASLPSPVKKEKKAKEMKAKTPPTAVAPSKKGLKEKEVAPASPGKKSVEKKAVRAPSAEKKVSKESTKTEGQPCSTEAYSPPFCLMPVRAPSPPLNPNGYNVNINRKPGQKGNFKNSLELPSYSGGRPVPPSESI